MKTRLQEPQLESPRGQKRLIFLLIGVGAIIWILSIESLIGWSSIVGAIFTILGVLLALLQWQANAGSAASVSAAYAFCLREHSVMQEHLPSCQSEREAARGIDAGYDVFVCYSPADQAGAVKLKQQLKARAMVVWLDSWRPGKPVEDQQREQIATIKSAVVLVGKYGIPPSNRCSASAGLRQFVERPSSVSLIPVFLADAPQEALPIFLNQFGWVDFRKHEPDPMRQLI